MADAIIAEAADAGASAIVTAARADRLKSMMVRDHLEQGLDLLPRYRQKLSTPRTGGLA